MSDPLEQVARYYTGKLHEHGPTPAGVDWNGVRSQRERFAQLLRVCDRDAYSLIDWGSGYGALLDAARALGHAVRYTGYDVADAMVVAGRRRFESDPEVRFVASEAELAPADFVVASGIFNVRMDIPHTVWGSHVNRTIDRMAELSRVGFAFNMLTRYADPGRMADHLHYADPSYVLADCATRISRHVAISQDYGLYEFTVLVRHAPCPAVAE